MITGSGSYFGVYLSRLNLSSFGGEWFEASFLFGRCYKSSGLWRIIRARCVLQGLKLFLILSSTVGWPQSCGSLLVWVPLEGDCWALHKHIQYLGSPLFRQFRAQVEEWQHTSSPLTLHRDGGGAFRSRTGSGQGARIMPTYGICPTGGVLVRFDGAWRKDVGGG
ncbi:unnamed protein product, partial [Linum tenue]